MTIMSRCKYMPLCPPLYSVPPPPSPQYTHTIHNYNMLTPDIKMKVLLTFQILVPCVDLCNHSVCIHQWFHKNRNGALLEFPSCLLHLMKSHDVTVRIRIIGTTYVQCGWLIVTIILYQFSYPDQ